jgi:hypothetical protein
MNANKILIIIGMIIFVFSDTYTQQSNCYKLDLSRPEWLKSDKDTFNLVTQTEKYSLIKVYPNPFSESTKIYYELNDANNVRLYIFNSLGEKITTLVDEWQEEGRHNCELRITNYELCSGMYYYRIQIGERIESGKMVLIR